MLLKHIDFLVAILQDIHLFIACGIMNNATLIRIGTKAGKFLVRSTHRNDKQYYATNKSLILMMLVGNFVNLL